MDKLQERGQKILSPWKLESRTLPRQAGRRGFSGVDGFGRPAFAMGKVVAVLARLKSPPGIKSVVRGVDVVDVGSGSSGLGLPGAGTI